MEIRSIETPSHTYTLIEQRGHKGMIAVIKEDPEGECTGSKLWPISKLERLRSLSDQEFAAFCEKQTYY